jgi:hypothetical protein
MAAGTTILDQHGKRRRKARKGIPVERVERALAFWRKPYEARFHQDLQVLRHRRLRKVELLDNLFAATALRLG